MKSDPKALMSEDPSGDECSPTEVEIDHDEDVEIIFVAEADSAEYFRILYTELKVLQENGNDIPLVLIPIFYNAPDLLVMCNEKGINNLEDLSLAAQTGFPNLDDIFYAEKDKELLDFVLSFSFIDDADTLRIKH